tara:strand:+ start:359 stop:844 length:486 start_codon:yes stop_codon:yes gene_type:complete
MKNLLITFLVLILGGCSLVVDEYQRDQRKVIAYLLEDMPLPDDAEIIKVPTVLLGTGDAISGRITLKSQYSPAENLVFYGNATPSTGWSLISSKVGEEVTLTYTKNGRFATIQMTPVRDFAAFIEGSFSSDIIISVVHPDAISDPLPFEGLPYPVRPAEVD